MSDTLDDLIRDANERGAILSPYASPFREAESFEVRFCIFVEQYTLEAYLDCGDPSPFPNGDMCFVVAARLESEDEAELAATSLWHQLRTEQPDLRKIVDENNKWT